MENTEDLCPAFFDGDRGFPYDLCGLCFLCASVFVKASSVILTLVFELKATAFAWMRAECPRHNGCRLLHGYGQAFIPDSGIPSEAGFANQGGTEGMENTEDLCPAFFDGNRWFPPDLCGLCFLWCLCGREGFKRDPDFDFRAQSPSSPTSGMWVKLIRIGAWSRWSWTPPK
jgi:hypothetical protein